ncbi:MAG TPA: nucleotidyltransferase family protein [Candidatus Avamphibacillus sp.]|nr:nucleotidyltransferase family protein [Candidatus Avamphibacillus sp.]
MTISNEKDIIKLIKEDQWMMSLLRTVKTLHLPDWWICAGFIRSKIWDTLHGFRQRTPLPDIDVIYFNPKNVDKLEEKRIEDKLKSLVPDIPWSVKNQARMHLKNNMPPYSSSVDGISKFPETVTALGVKLDNKDDVILVAPWGIDDIIKLEVRPTPFYKTKDRIKIYEERVMKKEWTTIWKKVNIYRPSSFS